MLGIGVLNCLQLYIKDISSNHRARVLIILYMKNSALVETDNLWKLSKYR